MTKKLVLLLLLSCLQGNLMAQEKSPPSPQEALDMLVKGNERYRTDKLAHPDISKERRKEIAEMQAPFACIVGCSDSRVAPEIIFDQGIGDLFIVRVAGNVVGPVEQDSIEYSGLYLKSSIVLVLGHQSCAAVKAVLDGTTKDIEAVAELIQPAVQQAKGQSGNTLENAVKDNVRAVVNQLRKSEVIAKLMAQNKIAVVGGYYNFVSGKVELLPETLK